ncbi:MAG: NUDIX hydrolase [Candidatus Ranarchaeia archaeon]
MTEYPDEILDVVNEDNQVIGKETRSNIHKKGLWHRGVHVLVFNKQDWLVLQKRSLQKKEFPGTWDCSVSEHVLADEAYVVAAARGLREELGITNVVLRWLMRFKFQYGPNDYKISDLFECLYDGPLRLNRTEIDQVHWFSLSAIEAMLNCDASQFSPWTREILLWVLEKPPGFDILLAR